MIIREQEIMVRTGPKPVMVISQVTAASKALEETARQEAAETARQGLEETARQGPEETVRQGPEEMARRELEVEPERHLRIRRLHLRHRGNKRMTDQGQGVPAPDLF